MFSIDKLFETAKKREKENKQARDIMEMSVTSLLSCSANLDEFQRKETEQKLDSILRKEYGF